MPEDLLLKNCPDCGVKPGQEHVGGCDVERCLVCKGQAIACGCNDPRRSVWTGEWPGVAECRERGWYTVFLPELGESRRGCAAWWPCTKEFPGAREDLNRWTVFVMRGEDRLKGFPLLGSSWEELRTADTQKLDAETLRGYEVAVKFARKEQASS